MDEEFNLVDSRGKLVLRSRNSCPVMEYHCNTLRSWAMCSLNRVSTYAQLH